MQAAAATFQQQTSLAHRAGPKTTAGPSAVAHTTVLQQQQQQRRQPRLALTRQQHRQPVVCAAAAVAPPAAIAALQQQLGTTTTTTTASTTTTTSISLGALVAMAQQGQLQVSAPEGLVQHSRKLASRLVVPVLQDKPTPPPITLVVRQQQQQAPTLTVVGGSGQRLSSLLAFVSGSDSLAGGRPWASAPVQLDSREDAFIRWDGKTFQQLPQATRQRVEQYRLNCVVVHEQRTVA